MSGIIECNTAGVGSHSSANWRKRRRRLTLCTWLNHTWLLCLIVDLCKTAAIILLAHRLNKYALLYHMYKASLVIVTVSIYVEILLKYPRWGSINSKKYFVQLVRIIGDNNSKPISTKFSKKHINKAKYMRSIIKTFWKLIPILTKYSFYKKTARLTRFWSNVGSEPLESPTT